MRRVWLSLALLLGSCALAHGTDIYDCYNGVAGLGGQNIVVNGIFAAQTAVVTYPGATVQVFNHGTAVLATIFRDPAGNTSITQPWMADAQTAGAYWCAADAYYDVQYSNGGIISPFTISDIHLAFNGGGGGGGGGCTVNPFDGGCAIAGSPSIDFFIGSVGPGTGWIQEILSTAVNFTAPIEVNDGTGKAGAWTFKYGTDPGVIAGGVTHAAPSAGTAYTDYDMGAACSGYWVLTNTANKVTKTCEGSINLAGDVGTSILPVANGGSGLATQTTNAIYKGNGTGALSLSGLTDSGSVISTAESFVVNGLLDGGSPVSPTNTASVTVGATNCSGYYDNLDGFTAITFTLPSSPLCATGAAKQYCFDNGNNAGTASSGTLKLLAGGSNFIIFTDGTNSASGGYVISGGAAGDAACVRGATTTQWQLYVQRGTWTKH